MFVNGQHGYRYMLVHSNDVQGSYVQRRLFPSWLGSSVMGACDPIHQETCFLTVVSRQSGSGTGDSVAFTAALNVVSIHCDLIVNIMQCL